MTWSKHFIFLMKKPRKYAKRTVKILPNHILTDTDSTSLMVQITCDFASNIPDEKYRDLIFEVIVENGIYQRFDTSHECWDKFNERKPELEERLGYFEIESIDNPCQVVVAVNPKEY